MIKPLYNTIVSPIKGNRYNNIKDNGFIINSHIDENDYKFVNRVGVIETTPVIDVPFKVGDEVIVHHNVFRQYWGFDCSLKDSDTMNEDGKFICGYDHVFMYRKPGERWNCIGDYIFVEPIKSNDMWSSDAYIKNKGIIRYSGNSNFLNKTILFQPYCEYEFNIDEKTLYKMSMKNVVGVY